MAKSYVIPLNAATFDAFERRKTNEVPGWAAMPVCSSCKYLGFQMGPGKGDSSWHKPWQKYLGRLDMWHDQPLGLHWNARVYNTFAVPTLGYVGQLETPPAWLLTSAVQSLRRVAKGPGEWAAADDLWALRESFGLAASFTNLEWYTLAAKIRVVQFDGACAPRGRFLADVARLQGALRDPPRERSRFAWNDWYNRSFVLTMAQAENQLMQRRATAEGLRRSRPAGD